MRVSKFIDNKKIYSQAYFSYKEHSDNRLKRRPRIYLNHQAVRFVPIRLCEREQYEHLQLYIITYVLYHFCRTFGGMGPPPAVASVRTRCAGN